MVVRRRRISTLLEGDSDLANIQDAAAKVAQGMQRLQAQNFEEAAAMFSAAITTYPQFETAFRLRAEAYRNLGRTQEANADLEVVIALTRARLQEAEQTLRRGGGRVSASPQPSPSTPASLLVNNPSSNPSLVESITRLTGMVQSPVILWTGIASIALILVAMAIMLIGGN